MKVGTPTYLASAADNQIVSTGPCTLHKIIVGKDVASSVIEISDHVSDGDGNLIAKIEGSALKGVYVFEATCVKGLTLDLANQTGVTVIWSPGA